MNTRHPLAEFIILAICMIPGVTTSQERPDIVLIMADDLGFSDIGCYGSEIPTPYLDRLADGGVRFVNFANTSRCCPSRASLLTGLYSHQVGVGKMNTSDRGPGYRGQLSGSVPTLAERLKDGGYSTFMVGKWHLTRTNSIDDGPNGSWPLERGFENFFGSMEGAKNYFAPKWFFDGRNELTEFDESFFYTDAIANRASKWIEHQPVDQPLFLYAAFYAPHFPLQAPQESVDPFRGSYRRGWDAVRAERFQRQKDLGLVRNWTRLSPRDPKVPSWDTLSPDQRDEMDLRMAIYAAQVHELDKGVGQIIESLRRSDRLDNTLVIFLSDNGGTNSGGAMGSGDPQLLGGRDAELRSTYGTGWANVSNTPFLNYKANAHQGGVMSPLIMHWPEKIAERGETRDTLAHIIDLVPTCLGAAGLTGDEESRATGTKLEGIDLLNHATDDLNDRTLFFEHQRSRAVRRGNWKLVNRGTSNEWELFNLANDPTELDNLAEQQPSLVDDLGDQWREWAIRCNVISEPGRQDSNVEKQAAVSLEKSGSSDSDDRPNILWIIADDLSPDLGCYETKAVRTPHIDSLADEGVRFTNAFATSPTCSPSRTAFITGMYQTSIGGHHHRTRDKPLLSGVAPVMQHFRDGGYFVCNMSRPEGGPRAKTDYNFEWDSELFDGDDWSQRAEGQPFFAQLQIKEPHRPFVENEDPDRVDNLELPPIYPDHPVTRADWANYLASIEVLDDKVGQVLRRLEDEGLSESTVVVFFGDHGRPQVWAKQWLYDAGIQVPLIIRWPGMIEPGTVDDRLVSLIDLAPSSLAAAQLPVVETMQGVSLLLSSDATREYIFAARDRCGDAVDRIRCVRSTRYKYIRNFEPQYPYTQTSSYKNLQYPVATLLRVLHSRGELDETAERFFAEQKPYEEFYDLQADPFETENLAADPDFARQVNNFRAVMDQWIVDSNDRGRVREGSSDYFEALREEKLDWYQGVMRRRGLDASVSDEDYLEWWTKELGIDR